MSDKLSQQYEQKFGGLSIHRGRDEDKRELFSWEPIPDCTDQLCPLTDKCHYQNREGNCQVVGKIVKAAATSIISNYGNKIDNAKRNRIGKQLMPLYVALAKLYVYEASLNSPHFEDNKGNPKIDPVYKEIRETIRSIDLQWKNLELMTIQLDVPDIEEDWMNDMEQEAEQDGKRRRKKSKQVIKLKDRK